MKILISFFDPQHDFHLDNWRQVTPQGIHAEFYEQKIEEYACHFLLSDDNPRPLSEQNDAERKLWTQFRALRSYLEREIEDRKLPLELRFSYLDMIQREDDTSRKEELLTFIQDVKEEFPESIIQAYITPGTDATRSIWHQIKEQTGIDLFRIPILSERGDRGLEQSLTYVEAGGSSTGASAESKNVDWDADLFTDNDSIKKVYERAGYIGKNSSDITLILGESGTGKEEIAKHIYNNSFRSYGKGDKGFFIVNCAQYTEQLLRSELFGHVKGAFTGAIHDKKGFFEIADNGTLLLDEIGDASLYTQATLLRVIQSGEFQKVGGTTTMSFDVQIICATNANLLEKIKAGTFRADLYYRFADPEIWTVPFRDFLNKDKKKIFNFFLRRGSQEEVETPDGTYDYHIKSLSDEALQILLRYDFPGNFREIKRLFKSFYKTIPGDVIEREDLPVRIQNLEEEELENYNAEYAKAQAVRRAYEKVGGIKKAAMHLTNIKHPATFNKLLKMTENKDHETGT